MPNPKIDRIINGMMPLLILILDIALAPDLLNLCFFPLLFLPYLLNKGISQLSSMSFRKSELFLQRIISISSFAIW